MESSWFNTALVVRKILDNFSHKEILNLTLVNRTWNFVGKSLLKARGNTVAILGTVRKRREHDDDEDEDFSSYSSDSPSDCPTNRRKYMRGKNRDACKDLVTFEQILRGMTTIPFSGLEINVNYKHGSTCPLCDESTVSLINTMVPINHFAMRGSSYLSHSFSKDYNSCTAFGSFPLILKENAHRLTEISVVMITEKNHDFESSFDSLEFPNLKVFKFDLEEFFNPPPSSTYSAMLAFLKKIVQSAPKLEEFHLNTFFSFNRTDSDEYNQCLEDFVSQVLESSKALLVCDQNREDASNLSKNCLSRLAVRQFHLINSYIANKNFDAWKAILQNSMRQLEKALLNVRLLTEIFLNGLPMMRLHKLCLSVARQYDDRYSPLLDAILRKCLWKRCLPNLKMLFLGTDGMPDGSSEELIAELISRLNRTTIIGCKEEEEDNSWLDVESLEHFQQHTFLPEGRCAFLCDLCPHVKHLELVQPMHESFVPHFYNRLKSVEHLKWSHVYPAVNVDHKLCGIHPEEAKLLREKDVEYLKRVHIVPVEPSITFLTSLKKLTIRTVVKGWGCGFSKVAAGLCFSRIPGLEVQLMVSASDRWDAAKTSDFLKVMNHFPEVRVGLAKEPPDGRYWVRIH